MQPSENRNLAADLINKVQSFAEGQRQECVSVTAHYDLAQSSIPWSKCIGHIMTYLADEGIPCRLRAGERSMRLELEVPPRNADCIPMPQGSKED